MASKEELKQIGCRLEKERKRLRLTGDQAAEIGGVCRRTQSFYENGRNAPSGEYLALMSKAGMDVLYVLIGDGSPSLSEVVPDFESSSESAWRQGFALRLANERKRLALSVNEFGALGGIKRQAQYKYEKAERLPDAEYLSRIAGGGVDIMYLLFSTRCSGDVTGTLKSVEGAPANYESARARAAELADDGLLLDILALGFHHGISDEGARKIAELWSALGAAR